MSRSDAATVDDETPPSPEEVYGIMSCTCDRSGPVLVLRQGCPVHDSPAEVPPAGLDPDVVLRALAVVEEHAALGPETRAICDAARAWVERRNLVERCSVHDCGNPAAGALCEDCWTELASSGAPRPSVAPAKPRADDATNPAHYRERSPEPIDVIEGWGLGFHLGNAIKYVARAGRKGDRLEDLRKGRWYLDREIAREEASRG